ncbi:MAG: squalene synthase HpnD [Magnetovibrio sp.]|nr:squalene synthase HpnD [Magnetovibrio sp.]|tara:strand:- start:380 stop:1258 length:879 start_codon:yes stop_codon:yes gene_type:complete
MIITTPALEDDKSQRSAAAHVECVVRQSETSFYWAMRFLAEQERQAMFAIYAFCREVDDLVDNPREESIKRVALGQWRGEIERIYGGYPRTLTGRALLPVIEKFELRKQDFRAVIDGMEMDAESSVRFTDMNELKLYCDRVAGAVGRISTDIFGLPREIGEMLASAEGLALQLTNILRDLAEDSQRNRLYVPADLLAAHEIDDTDDLNRVLGHPRLPEVCEILADIAVLNFEQAQKIAVNCDRNRIRPAMIMLQIYRRILSRLRSRGWTNIDVPVPLSKATKFWIALRYGVL